MPAPSSPQWLSTHLHFDAPTIYGADADHVIRCHVVPLVAAVRENCDTDCFFFVRYSDGGPHIRVRFRERLGSRSDRVRDVTRERLCLFGSEAGVTVIRPVAAEYDREVQRYGGLSALSVSERIFEASSIAAIAQIGTDALSLSARLGRALVAMLATVNAFLPDHTHARAFAGRYCEGYLPSLAAWRGRESRDLIDVFRQGFAPQEPRLTASIADLWYALVNRDAVSDAIDAYAASLCQLREELRKCFNAGQVVVSGAPASSWSACVYWLLPSYVHMMNNRLGVSIEHEAYLAYIISAGLTAMDSSLTSA